LRFRLLNGLLRLSNGELALRRLHNQIPLAKNCMKFEIEFSHG